MYRFAYGKARITGSEIMLVKNILYQSIRKKMRAACTDCALLNYLCFLSKMPMAAKPRLSQIGKTELTLPVEGNLLIGAAGERGASSLEDHLALKVKSFVTVY